MTDNEMMAIVSRNMQGALDLPGSAPDRGHMRRFYPEVDAIGARLAKPEAAALREQAGRALDFWLDAMQQALDEASDAPEAPLQPSARRPASSGYVGRTVIPRSGVDTVNSIFRAFR